MAHPQNTPRGLWASKRYDIGASNITADSTGLVLSAGVKVSNKANAVLTGNSTGLVVVGGVKISNAQTLTANSTGYLPTTVTALPGNVQFDGFAVLKNSTGNMALMLNTTGTTWKYLNTTSVLPT